jgi:hypothetical protein
LKLNLSTVAVPNIGHACPLPDSDNLRVTERLIELDADLAIAIQGGIDFNSEWIVSNEDNPRSRNLLPVNF